MPLWGVRALGWSEWERALFFLLARALGAPPVPTTQFQQVPGPSGPGGGARLAPRNQAGTASLTFVSPFWVPAPSAQMCPLLAGSPAELSYGAQALGFRGGVERTEGSTGERPESCNCYVFIKGWGLWG